jgi:hypothetical protein
MNTKLAITVSLLALLSIGLLGQALAQTRVPGVKANDTFTYSLVTHFTTENASEPIPADFQGLNQTTKYTVSIGGIINGTLVDATHLWYLKNETNARPYLYTVELVSGTPNDTSGTYPPLLENVVGANLKAGDLLHPSGNDLVIINQTINRNYIGGSRPTNVVELNGPIQNQTTDSNNQTILETVGYQDVTFYLDQATGILVMENTTIQSIIPTKETASIIWTLTSTNLWDASPASSLPLLEIAAIVAVVVIVVVLVIVVYRMRRKGRRRRR